MENTILLLESERFIDAIKDMLVKAKIDLPWLKIPDFGDRKPAAVHDLIVPAHAWLQEIVETNVLTMQRIRRYLPNEAAWDLYDMEDDADLVEIKMWTKAIKDFKKALNGKRPKIFTAKFQSKRGKNNG